MKYPLPMRLLHWASALLILGLISLGFLMTPFDMENPEYSDQLYFWHKSFGVLVLILILARLLVRWRSELPPPPDALTATEKLASAVVHKLLYFLAIAVPAMGYVQSSAHKSGTGVHFFFVKLPELVPDSERVFELFNLGHRICAYALLGLVLIHVIGAVKHRVFDDAEADVFQRML